MTRLFCFVFILAFILPAHAELADRDKPITLEADRIIIDDLKRTQVFEGNVVLTQGTLVIHSDKIVVTEDAHGFQRGVAYSGPDGLARFRQKREGREEFIEGEAERIEYDTHHEIAELFNRAWIQSGGDQLRGDYIWYDGISERYKASSSADNAHSSSPAQDSAPPRRVIAIIQPKKPDTTGATDTPELPDPAKAENDLRLKSTTDITEPERP
ncbi:MAG: lipopolysaccharide transport periplasmic protein LptA [Betaproteobacteria bacterium]|nr:lipopolysaccharide transport periplasmic protein LptA [Betaproteobacteria bacterium]